MVTLLLALAASSPKVEFSTAWDVPAVAYQVPASRPCNVSPGGGYGWTYAVCITESETRWKCSDSARILLTSEDGAKHCILFPPQVDEVVKIEGGRK